MEADKLGLDTADQKFILCNFPLHRRDPMYEECLNAIKQAAEDHRSINVCKLILIGPTVRTFLQPLFLL